MLGRENQTKQKYSSLSWLVFMWDVAITMTKIIILFFFTLVFHPNPGTKSASASRENTVQPRILVIQKWKEPGGMKKGGGAVNKRQLRHEPDARWTLWNHFHVSTSPTPPAAQRQFRLAIPPAALKESSVWGGIREPDWCHLSWIPKQEPSSCYRFNSN